MEHSIYQPPETSQNPDGVDKWTGITVGFLILLPSLCHFALKLLPETSAFDRGLSFTLPYIIAAVVAVIMGRHYVNRRDGMFTNYATTISMWVVLHFFLLTIVTVVSLAGE